MSTPLVPTSVTPPAPRAVEPSAIAGKTTSAVFEFGHLIREIVFGGTSAFKTENQMLAADEKIRNFVDAFAPGSSKAAMEDGTQRAPMEDVSKRPSPSGVQYAVPGGGNAPIDYNKLARALVLAQEERANELAQLSVTPAPAQTQAAGTDVSE
jgi:hypothetical protein